MLSLEHPNQVGKFPDPGAESTFRSACLDWTELNHPDHLEWLELHHKLLTLRQRELTPRLRGLRYNQVGHRELGRNAFCMTWTLTDQSSLTVYVNLDDRPRGKIGLPPTRPLVSTHEDIALVQRQECLPPWFVACYFSHPK
jgi:1,4-alpha-glucan branching enzyme